MAIEQTTRSDSALQDRLASAVGGVDNFASNWSWRSHSPKQRAESALIEGAQTIGDGIAVLTENGATADQVEEWTAKAIRLWLAYQAAGARTANPMITGPANFPVARNQKAMAAERKRGDEYYLFAQRPVAWLIANLKGEAFRWSPREGAWQRKNTNNGVQAAYRILRGLGHRKGKLNEGTPTPTKDSRP